MKQENDTIIEGLQEYIAECPYLSEFTENHIDFTDEDAGNYGILPTGDELLQIMMYGLAKRIKYNFSLCARNFTVDDVQRVANSKFVEHFSDWLMQKNAEKDFPDVGPDCQPYRIEGANGILFDIAENADTGLYQVQCSLFCYKKVRKQ